MVVLLVDWTVVWWADQMVHTLADQLVDYLVAVKVGQMVVKLAVDLVVH